MEVVVAAAPTSAKPALPVATSLSLHIWDARVAVQTAGKVVGR